MQRFFLKQENFRDGHIEITEPSTLHQLGRVLRMQTGNELIILDNSGDEFLCRIERLDEKSSLLTIIEKKKNVAEPEIFVTLYQALPKKLELFELVLQKGTEIGVSRFVPLITERTERREVSKRDRMEKILKEAAEQCERGKIPELSEAQKLDDALTNANGKQKILLHGRGNHPLLSKIITKQTLKVAPSGRIICLASPRLGLVDIFTGPEGGFTDSEIQQAAENGFLVGSLGPRVLRTETAGIVAASLILNKII